MPVLPCKPLALVLVYCGLPSPIGRPHRILFSKCAIQRCGNPTFVLARTVEFVLQVSRMSSFLMAMKLSENQARRRGFCLDSFSTLYHFASYPRLSFRRCKSTSSLPNTITYPDMAFSTYWMAGLAPDAAHFFKYLFILVLYTLAMTLFVSFYPHTNVTMSHDSLRTSFLALFSAMAVSQSSSQHCLPFIK